MKKSFYLTLSLLVLMLCNMQAEAKKSTINVSGTISYNTTWTGVDTILVTGNITIKDGVTLTIDPGMKVVFEGHYCITVKGRLLAIGTESDTIVFTVTDTTGYHNHSHTGWRGIRIWNPPAGNDSTKLVFCRLEYGKNVDSERGGALLITGFKKLLVDHCEFRYNYASMKGGAVFIWSGGGGRYANSYFHHNSAAYDGGALFSWDSIYINHCRFEHNYAGTDGGAINILQSIFEMTNNLLANNKANGRGGGICVQNSYNSFILNNTIANNTAHTGGGVYTQNRPPDLRNCIIYANHATTGKQVYLDGGFYSCNFYYCDIEGGKPGIAGSIGDYENCIDMDPCFSETGDHPFSLLNTSSCINKGDPATTTGDTGPYDLAGNPRIYNGYEDVIDIGAYEFQGDPAPKLISVFPLDNSAIADTDPVLKMVFSTKINPGSGTITIHNQDGSVFEQMAALDPSVVTIDSNIVELNPINNFSPGFDYYILVDSAAFLHMNGQYFGGIYDNESWNISIGEVYVYAGRGLRFDGDNDYVGIDDNDSLDLTTHYTLEAWIKPASFGYLDGIISKYQTAGAYGYYLRLLADAPYTGIGFDGMQTASGILTAGEWHHIVGVNDNGTRKLYVNGELQPLTGTPNSIKVNKDPLRIGVDYSSRFFHGEVDEARIWKIALTEEQIRASMHVPLDGSEPGLTCYFQFNEEEGAHTYDFISGLIGDLHHMENHDRVKSTIPFGHGSVDRQIVSSSGNVVFQGTGFTADFTSYSGTDTIYVSRIDTVPNDLPATVDTVYDSQYWAIQKYGNGSFGANVSFTVTEDLTSDDQNNPANIRLYGRGTYSTGDWSLIIPADSVNATSNTAYFSGITSPGQFLLGRHQGTTPFLVTSLYPEVNGSMKYNDDLKITFNEDASAVAGKSIFIRNLDGSLFEQITLPSTQVTGEGTETISINPSNEMILGSEYYVLIDHGAFQDPFGKDFEGFQDPSDWNFMVLYDGHIKENSVWKDTIIVSGNVTVDNGITLTIEPGTVVMFDGNFHLDINGRLLAIGTRSERIMFTKTGSARWDAITFTNVSPTNDTSKLIHCILEHAEGHPVGFGGPVRVVGTDKLLLSDCIIRHNGMSHGGSALDCTTTKMAVKNCYFHNNHALSGAAISCGHDADITVINSAFYDNKGDWGGGALYLENADAHFINSTFCNNVALDSSYGGAISYLSGNPEFRNCILYGNMSDFGPNQIDFPNIWGASANFYYCDVQGGKEAFTGDGAGENYNGIYQHNMDKDPQFVGSGDFPCQLTIPSPCFNAGDPATNPDDVGMYDAAGNFRFQHGRIDMGAYELSIEPDGFPGHTVWFDGAHDHIDISHHDDFNLPQEITVEAWIKPESVNHNCYLLRKGDIKYLHWDVSYESVQGKGIQLNLPGLNTGWWEFQYDMEYGKWYHVAWTRASDGTLTAYINGEIVRNGHFPGNITGNTDDLLIASLDGTQRYKGLIDELRISGVARSTEEIRRNMYLTLPEFNIDFLAYWQFNEGSGDNIYDITQRYTGTLFQMNQDNWKNSAIPFGSGESVALLVTGTGTYDFSQANVTIDFNAIVTTDTVVVSRLDIAPNTVPSNVSMVMDSSYWIINDYGSGNFNCDISFSPAEPLTAEDEMFPHRLKLFTRQHTSDGSWQFACYASDVNATNHTVSFSGIDEFGQFLITRDIVPDNFPGSSLLLVEDDDRIELVNNDLLMIDTAFTVETWINTDFSGIGYQTLAKNDEAWVIRMFTDPAVVIIEFGINSNSLFASVTTDASFYGKWNHIACVYNHTGSNNHISILLNGERGSDEDSEQITVTSDTVLIGNGFTGQVDEFRIWNTARSDTAIREDMHLTLTDPEAGLLSYLQFNEGSGTTLFDVASDAEAQLFNMDPAVCWNVSTIPAGGGISDTQDEAWGEVIFTGTGLFMNYNSYGTASVTATRIDNEPNLNPTDPDIVFDSQYWVVNRFGSGSFNTSMTFAPDERLTSYDVANPQKIRLYGRDSNSDGSWTLLREAASVDKDANTATFGSITGFGQFIIGRDVRTPDRFPGACLAFDGENDHVSGSGIDSTLSNITLEAWVYHNSLPAEVQRYITVSPEVAVIRFDGTQYGGYHSLHFYIKRPDGSMWSSRVDSILATGEWMHVAGTYDGKHMKTYVNGELVKSTTQDKGMYPANGQYGFGSGSLDGKLEEVRIWNVSRSAQEIRESMHVSLTGIEPGLYGCWQFNEGSGNTVHDIASGNDGTLVNMAPSNWINSTIPFGGGYSQSKTETTGEVDFPETGLSMFFHSQSGAEITVSRIDTMPNLDPLADTTLDAQYWAIHRFSTSAFEADLTFSVTDDLTSYHEANPSLIKLYTRATTADSSWILLKPASSVDAATDRATFNNLDGFGQFIIGVDHPGIKIDPTVFLEGPFDSTHMNPYLNPDVLPLAQPFNTSPWNYQGAEAVASIPNPDIVDWVLIELRDTTNAGLASGSTRVGRTAAFLLRDGSVRELNGESLVKFNIIPQDSLYLIVWHRNHLGVMSAFGLIENAGVYSHNFTIAENMAYDGADGHKEIAPGIWGMISGDGNSDGEINNGDKIDVWSVQAGSNGYLGGDFNMDSHVGNSDKNDLWVPNTGHSCRVPD